MATEPLMIRGFSRSAGAVAILLLVTPALLADEIKEADVAAAVETWVRHAIADARPDAAVERMQPHRIDGRTVAYIAHLKGGGYCLCGADDLVLPVYLYCPTGAYDPEHPGNQYILWEIGARLANLRTGLEKDDPKMQPFQATLTERAATWQSFIARHVPDSKGDGEDRGDPDMMVLPLTCNWKQGWPYNSQCPELPPGSGTHTIVGCVSTAMCQIMYYWQWPLTGESSHSTDYDYRWRSGWDSEPCATDPGIPGGWSTRLQWTATGGGQLQMNGYWDHSVYGQARRISEDSGYRNALEDLYDRLTQESTSCYANFGATSYNWSILKDVHEDPPDAGDTEAAELSYHGAIATNMNWGIWLSLASNARVAVALESFFRYDPDTVSSARSVDLMTQEIQWFRPLQMRGGDPERGGHAWVVYGYDKSTDPDRLFLMNMGWGGSGDGWYSCDSVDPPPYHFDEDQSHVTHIAPESVVRFVDYGTSGGDGTPNNPYLGLSHALSTVPDDTTLILKAGSAHTLSGEPVVLDQPVTLKGYDVTITQN